MAAALQCAHFRVRPRFHSWGWCICSYSRLRGGGWQTAASFPFGAAFGALCPKSGKDPACNPFEASSWRILVDEIISANSAENTGHCLVYIQVTRGVAPRAQAFPENVSPTVFMMTMP